jgi:predicted RNA-binding Zn ribbon-like protein
MNQLARSTNGGIIRPSNAMPNHGRSWRGAKPVAPTKADGHVAAAAALTNGDGQQQRRCRDQMGCALALVRAAT